MTRGMGCLGLVRRPRSALADDTGFTLVELMATLVVGSLVVASLVRGMTSAHQTGDAARRTTQATAQARGAVERARGLGWSGLGHVPGATASDPQVSSGEFDPDGSGPLDAESIVENADGLLDPYVVTETIDSEAFEVRTYVTFAGAGAKRITAVAGWVERARARSVSSSTIVAPTIEDVGSAAYLVGGEVPAGAIDDVARVEADAGGGTASQTFASFSPSPSISGTGGTTEATVAPGPSAHADASASAATIALPGLSVSASSVSVQADSTPTSMSASGTGRVTVNGVPYVNPSAGTILSVAGYRIVLNDQRREADGSLSITYIRISGPSTELSVCWAWVRPVEFLHA